MNVKKIVFWQNFLSPHQVGLFRGLVRQGICVTLVAESLFDDHRAKMGWQLPSLDGIEMVVSPGEQVIDDLLNSDPANVLHIFPLARNYRLSWTAFKQASRLKRRVAIYSEYFYQEGVLGIARRLRGRLDAIRFGRGIEFILAVGSRGVDWFEDAWFPREKIFEFGYFVEKPLAAQQRVTPRGDVFQVLFVGQLTRRKSVDLLISALRPLSAVQLVVVGDGPERCRLETMVREFGMEDRVEFTGMKSQPDVLNVIRSSDILVLPSKEKEGWGAVVNEALLQGVPVICTSICGASTLLGDPIRGMVIPPGDVAALSTAIENEAKHAGSIDRRELIKNWADQCIETGAAARYLLEIANFRTSNGTRPSAPWK